MGRLFSSFVSNIRLYIAWLFQKNIKGLVPVNAQYFVFIPHGGMYTNGYDFFNYSSDNALSLLNFMVRTYGNKYIYRLACDIRQYDSLHEKLVQYSSDNGVDLDCFPFFNYSGLLNFKKYSSLLKARMIFMSEMYPLYTKKNSQKVVFLNYFIPFKEDYGYRKYALQKMNDVIDYSFTTSLLSSYIISTVYRIDLSKCFALGFSRNDSLLSCEQNVDLERTINDAVDYQVKHVLLYTPTHREYERESHVHRSFLGIDINYQLLEDILRANNAVIICKLHAAQNADVIDKKLPKGVIVHSSTSNYGLCELLSRADCLITDYTSTYFDYLLLDRPVLFNFYDYDLYKQKRGFSYDPLEPFLAGDVFRDEKSFLVALKSFFEGKDIYSNQRQIIRDIHHKYRDTNTSERICNFLLEND